TYWRLTGPSCDNSNVACLGCQISVLWRSKVCHCACWWTTGLRILINGCWLRQNWMHSNTGLRRCVPHLKMFLSPAQGTEPSMHWINRIAAVSFKEFRQLSRDRLTFGMVVMLPLIQLLLFGYAINNNIR